MRVQHFLGLILVFIAFAGCSSDSNTKRYNLSTTATPTEGGTITPTSREYEEAEEVEISASSNEHWLFDGWQGDLLGDENPQTITMDSDKNVAALFVKRDYPLTITTEGQGSVSEQIVQQKSTDYPHETVVELTAKPANGWEFDGWQGDIETTENPTTVTIEGETEITVVFSRIEYPLVINVEGEGAVNEEIVQSKTDYAEGTLIELTAEPEDNWTFSEWGGDLEGDENPSQITVDGPKEVTATFFRTYNLTTNASPEEGGTITPETGQYVSDSTFDVEAIPSQGWQFVEWEGDFSGSVNPFSLTMNGNKTIIANFEKISGQLKVTTVTTGKDENPSDYSVVMSEASKIIEANGSVSFSTLDIGSYQVELKDVPSHCTVKSSNPVTIHISRDQISEVQFGIDCEAVLRNKIIFSRFFDAKRVLYKINPDGSGLEQIPTKRLNSLIYQPRISPDGTVIAFSQDRSAGLECRELYIALIGVDGTFKSSNFPSGRCSVQRFPTWSTNGNKIAYTTINEQFPQDEETGLYKIRPDGSDKFKILSIGGVTGLDWSPIESKLVYAYKNDLYTVRSDGENVTNLTSEYDFVPSEPRWSLDGNKILFTVTKDETKDIYVINANGDHPINLTKSPNSNDSHGAWSPDGKHIVFMSYKNDISDIYVMKADGSSRKNITNSPASRDRYPEWSPVQ